MAGGAVVGEQLPAFGRTLLAFRKRRDMRDQPLDVGTLQDAILAEGGHLRDAAVGMGAVDADADRLGHGLGVVAPHPGRAVEPRKARPAPALRAMTGLAVFAEQRRRRGVDARHQRGVGADRGEVLGQDLAFPRRAAGGDGGVHGVGGAALIGAPQALGESRAERPGGQQNPADHRVERGHHEKENHDSRHWRVEFGDAVPVMAGGAVAAERIARS